MKSSAAIFLLVLSSVFLSTASAQMGDLPAPSASGDYAHIDGLNEESLRCIRASKRDSAWYFADLALRAASAIRYTRGLAIANLRKCQVAKHFDADVGQGLLFGMASLREFEKAADKTEIDDAYLSLFDLSLAAGNLEDAILYSDLYYAYASSRKNEDEIFESLMAKCAVNRQGGNYQKSLEYAQQLYDIARLAGNKVWIANSLWSLGQLYKLIDDIPDAMVYYRKVYEMSDTEVRNDRLLKDREILFDLEFAELFTRTFRFDSAAYYYRLWEPSNPNFLGIYRVSMAENEQAQGNYRGALDLLALALADHEKKHNRRDAIRALIDRARVHLALSEFPDAIRYAREGLAQAEDARQRLSMRDAYQILSTVFDRTDRKDSANFYFRKYSFENEAMLNDQVRGNFKAYTYDQQIANMNREKQIREIRLQKETLVRKFLVAGILVILVFAFFLFRNTTLARRSEARRRELAENALQIQQLESEKSRAELMRQKAELEMQALRARMNPHFIFNCLNSINRFIIRNDAASASDYLTKFAKLIRKVLEESAKPFALLDEELQSLQLYMDLEAIRFESPFRYEIDCRDADRLAVMIPSLVIQPFVENAIWHGLHPRQGGNGILRIKLMLDGEILRCDITDNGVGRASLEGDDPGPGGRKSLGLQLTRERLEVADTQRGELPGFSIEDLRDEGGRNRGTTVHLRIPVKFV